MAAIHEVIPSEASVLVEIATQHPTLVSSEFLEEMRKDAELFESVAPIGRLSAGCTSSSTNTVLQAGRGGLCCGSRSLHNHPDAFCCGVAEDGS